MSVTKTKAALQETALPAADLLKTEGYRKGSGDRRTAANLMVW